MKSFTERLKIADEIVRRIDTVTLLTCDEVRGIRIKALAGEFDTIFDRDNQEENNEKVS